MRCFGWRMRLLGLLLVSICQHTSAHVSIRQHTGGCSSFFSSYSTSAYVSIPADARASSPRTKRQHTSAHVSTRQHTSAYVSIPADARASSPRTQALVAENAHTSPSARPTRPTSRARRKKKNERTSASVFANFCTSNASKLSILRAGVPSCDRGGGRARS
jgi:hypothetical protein